MKETRIRWLLLVPACVAAVMIALSAALGGDLDIAIDDDITAHLDDAIICEGGSGTDPSFDTAEAGQSRRLLDDSPTIDESI